MENYERATEALVECVRALERRAWEIVNEYWTFVNEHVSANSGWGNKSSMQLSCGSVGNHISVKWTALEWRGKAGKRWSIRKAIPRKKDSFTYNERDLRKYAKDWEIEKVLETEKKLESVRRQAHHIVRAIMSIRSAKKVNRVTPIFDIGEEDADEMDAENELSESET